MAKMTIPEFERLAESVAQLQHLDVILVRVARVDREARKALGCSFSDGFHHEAGIPTRRILDDGILGGLLVNAVVQGLLAKRAVLVGEIGDVVDLPPAPDFSHLGADGEFDAEPGTSKAGA